MEDDYKSLPLDQCPKDLNMLNSSMATFDYTDFSQMLQYIFQSIQITSDTDILNHISPYIEHSNQYYNVPDVLIESEIDKNFSGLKDKFYNSWLLLIYALSVKDKISIHYIIDNFDIIIQHLLDYIIIADREWLYDFLFILISNKIKVDHKIEEQYECGTNLPSVTFQ